MSSRLSKSSRRILMGSTSAAAANSRRKRCLADISPVQKSDLYPSRQARALVCCASKVLPLPVSAVMITNSPGRKPPVHSSRRPTSGVNLRAYVVAKFRECLTRCVEIADALFVQFIRLADNLGEFVDCPFEDLFCLATLSQ